MAPDPLPARARLDEVESGLDAVEAALARLDAGDVAEPAVGEAPSEATPGNELAAGEPASRSW